MTEPKTAAAPALEWAVGGLGALIFCALVAILVFSGLRGADRPPDIRVRAERIAPAGHGYVLEFTARNEGDITAADVEIVARLGAEEHRARFDYLPPHSQRRGGFFFAQDPRRAEIAFSADGYNDP